MKRGIVDRLASLRLTVVLLALAMVVIFVGTLAQTRLGVWQAVEQYFRSPVAWVDPGLFLPRASPDAPPRTFSFRIPIPGGLTLTLLMIVNLLAAHAARFRATRRRIGVLVLHAGLIVLLVGELVTGFLSHEGLMAIDEGRGSSFLEDVRAVELAVIDQSDPSFDRVVSVPGTMLAHAARHGSAIADRRLPFDIAVTRWLPNADLVRSSAPDGTTHGAGLALHAQERPRVAGVEGGASDSPAAYVTLTREGRTLGTWLVSSDLVAAQPVEVDGVRYGLALRYARTHLPFTLHLRDFRHDIFTGTTIPRNFSSDLRLVDPARGVDREVHIRMNHPLRYAGRTFYQASYKPDGSGTVLQVVHNPGRHLPYIASALVGLGMAWHFGQTLVGFLGRRSRAPSLAAGAPGAASGAAGRTRLRIWPWLVGLCAISLAVSGAFRPHPRNAIDLESFGLIPVSSGGRIKPLDTAARAMLMVACGRQSVRTEDGRIPATRILLDLVTRPERIVDLPLVRVDHPDVLGLLSLAPEEGGRISLRAIEPHWEEVAAQAERASSVQPRARDGFQREVLRLHDRVSTLLAHARMHEPYAIPPLSPEGEWRPFHEAFLDEHGAEEPHPTVAYLTAMMAAAHDDDPAGFNSAAGRYLALLDSSMPEVMRRARLEVLFNRASPFSGAAAVYLLAALAACASFVLRARAPDSRAAESFRVGGLALLVGAIIVHTAAIAVRIYLQGRPPVTNLYSSAIFVGWAAALAGVVLERLFPMGVSILGSASIGCATLIIAHNLGNDGDTMQMMQAVLDSNFWLATHVITITLGYSATFLAGAIAALRLLGSAFTRRITPERERAMGRIIYGVVCAALLLSFVGTVLGGIWADQSWGRFWGWDPKENGAALVVLMNAIILHARWGGLVKSRGVAVLAVAGNIVTMWSWFGTNMLGVGLHAYGFMDSAAFWLVAFVLSQGAIMALGLVRPRLAP